MPHATSSKKSAELELKASYFNEWKFMHAKTSNNSSNQSDFNKSSTSTLSLLCREAFYLNKKKVFVVLSLKQRCND
ncbi:CLUMA_CG019364, isoform A [Clunio marinus]|uniref:CLUMA_CG019364, isoform A n=1 Tax=Clunio marinus TaxID=568069 RepID=A0A1J1J3S1_9DIPT|nr:CLUMA_CG019364, isoform A [Clunio marinus]